MTKKSLDDEKTAEREYANFILDQDKIRMELETQAIVRRKRKQDGVKRKTLSYGRRSKRCRVKRQHSNRSTP